MLASAPHSGWSWVAPWCLRSGTRRPDPPPRQSTLTVTAKVPRPHRGINLPSFAESTPYGQLARIADLHARLATNIRCDVPREEYLDHMTFRANQRPLFTEIFGPLVGLKEEWAAQGATPEELDLSAFQYRYAQFGYLPVTTGWVGENQEEILEETDTVVLARDARPPGQGLQADGVSSASPRVPGQDHGRLAPPQAALRVP